MLICPDCHEPLAGEEPSDCTQCDWSCEFIDGVPVLLSSFDRSAPSFRDYKDNYEQIAADDLAESIQPAHYLARAAETIAPYLGSVEGLRVCEIGVGQGLLFEKLLASSPSSLTGVDISLAYLQRCRPHVSSIAEWLPVSLRSPAHVHPRQLRGHDAACRLQNAAPTLQRLLRWEPTSTDRHAWANFATLF